MLDHPLIPGDATAIEKGPWHYGADYIAVYFRANERYLKGLIPRPFEIDGGEGIAYVCEIISVSDSSRSLISKRPDRTLYNEAAIGVKCKFNERSGVFYPVMWVTTEWSLLRGLLNGYQKRLADRISMTKLHPLNPGLGPVGQGMEFGGFCMKGPEQTLAVDVKIQRPGVPSDLLSFGPTFGLRRFPQTDASQGSIEEPVEILKSNSKVSDVWIGSGSLKTGLELGDIQPISGSIYKGGFTISGSKVLR